MTLTAGARLGPYEIISPLGSGGMGEVYRARDARLGRDVAIKVLQAAFVGDRERLKRFEREARSASALNHPNIVTILDIGAADSTSYIAMELVGGEPLRAALDRGALPLRRLLQVSVQMAEGLAKAHASGIVHRDLKPENVMVTDDGLVKILDFGLAKLTQPETIKGDVAEGPTVTGHTEPGLVMGTAGYMSPEQALGQSVDFRSDQFAFGAILYEMATGRRAFHRESAPETLAAVIREEPEPIAALNPRIPAPLRWIVERCLAKERRNRYASTEDLARDLAVIRDHLSEATSGSAATSGAKPVSRRRPILIVAGALLLLAAGIGNWLAIKASRVEPPQYTRITFNRGTIWAARFTPDGQNVVYSASLDGKPHELYSVRLGNPASVPLGLPPAVLLSIARDGEMAILMETIARGQMDIGTLAHTPLGGGAPRQVSKPVSDASWGPNGKMAILRWSEDESAEFLEYPAGTVLYEVRHPEGYRTKRAGSWMRSPAVSPDGQLVAFLEHPVMEDEAGAVAVVDLAGRKRVISPGWTGVWNPVWSPRGDELWFTAEGRTETPGKAIRAVNLSGKERIVLTSPGRFRLRDVSRDGRLLISREIFRTPMFFGGQGLERERDLGWLDISDVADLSADGKTLLFGGDNGGAYLRGTDGGPVVPLGEGNPISLSPDGKWAITQISGSNTLTLLPTGPGEPRKLSFPGLDDASRSNHKWFPDSRHLVVSARRGKEDPRCFIVDLEGGVARPLSPEGTGLGSGVSCWPSPDGKWVTTREGDDKLVLYPVGSGEPRRVGGLEADDRLIQWSSDSRWIYLYPLTRHWPIRVFRFDTETGKRELWKELVPADVAGIDEPLGAPIKITPDGKFYAFSVGQILSDLFVVDRAR